MSKFTIILLVAVFAACINANDLGGFGGLLSGGESWMNSMSAGIDKAMKDSEQAIESTVPGANEMFKGHSHMESHNTATKNGQVVEDKAARKDVDNDNGHVTVTGTGN